MKNNQRGSLAIALIIILALAAVGFGTYVYVNKEPLFNYPEPASYVPPKHETASTTAAASSTASITASTTVKTTVTVPPVSAQAHISTDPDISLAKCITASGAKFYGAYWCPHCMAQKKTFGAGQTYLPYIECSTPDGQDQTPVCKNNNINQYPTWTFTDGTTLTGEQTHAVLAAKTHCPLQQ